MKLIFLVIPVLNLLLSTVYDHDARWLRLGVFLGFFALTSLRPIIGLCFTIACFAWFEIPVLKLGYPNMFLSDVTILGCLAGLLLHEGWRPSKDRDGSTAHVFYFPLIFAVLLLILQFTNTLFELREISYEGISKTKFAALIGRKVWNWDIRNNPVHALSVANGYLLQLGLIASVVSRINKSEGSSQRIKIEQILWAVIFGSVPVFIYALAQRFDFLSNDFSIGIAGPFQNKNILSFYSGMVVLSAVYLCCKYHEELKPKTALTTLFVALIGLYFVFLGESRTSIFALAAAFMGFFSIELMFHQNKKRYFVAIITTFFVATFLLIAALKLTNLSENPKWTELIRLIQGGSLKSVLLAGGRETNLPLAWSASFEYPWTGIGLGNFFTKAGVNYEIHNHFLDWIVGFGWLSLPLCLFFVARSFYFQMSAAWPQKKSADPSYPLSFLCAVSLFLFVTMFFDHYFSYRSVLSTASVLLCVPTLGISLKPSRGIYFGLIALVLALTASRFTNPQSRPSGYLSWDVEYNQTNGKPELQWHGTIYRKSFEDECLYIHLRPVFPKGSLTIHASSVTAEQLPSKFVSFNDQRQFRPRLNHQSFELPAGTWTGSCFCLSSDFKNRYLLLMSERGEYLSLSKYDFGADDRFISFGTGNNESFNRQNAKGIAAQCHKIHRL